MKQHCYSLALFLFSVQSYGMLNHDTGRTPVKLGKIESLIEAARDIDIESLSYDPYQSQLVHRADPFPVQTTDLPPLVSLELPRPPLVAPLTAICRAPIMLATHEKEVQTPAPQQDGKSGYFTSFKLESRIKKTGPRGPKSSLKYADKRGGRKPQYPNSCVFSQFDPGESVCFENTQP